MEAIYDIESFPNFFCAGFQITTDPDDVGYMLEISDRKNESAQLYHFITKTITPNGRLIGFNNLQYDWPMLDHFVTLMHSGTVTAAQMYEHNQELFQREGYGKMIRNPLVPQLDLMSLHHLFRFGVSLKQCQFAMRARSIEDSPVEFGTWLTPAQMDRELQYCAHDIASTKTLWRRSRAAIEFRETINPDWVSFNDGRLGKDTFRKELEAAGVQTIDRQAQGGWKDSRAQGTDFKKRQTPRRDGVCLGEVILPLIRFMDPKHTAMLERIKAEVAWAPKDGDKLTRKDGTKIKHQMVLGDFHIDIKLGGIHGSLDRKVVRATPGRPIVDADVTSYYPSIAIVHGFYPDHLTPEFCRVYDRLKTRRVALEKKDPKRLALKFALNVPFGSSNDRHSFFFDPAYMLAITMNGQLMLCMLAEALHMIPGVRLIQVNTDGVTIQYDVEREGVIADTFDWWQHQTGMDLEFKNYRSMHIRDANNYLAEDVDGGRKRIGAYGYGVEAEDGSYFWQQDQSEAVIARAAEAAMLDDIDPLDFLRNHPDAWDFLCLKKAPRGSHLQLADGRQLPRHTRYYISTSGQQLQKVMPPLAGKTNMRTMRINAQGQAKAITIPGPKIRPAGYRCSICDESFKTKGAFDDHNGSTHAWKVTPCNVFDGKMPQDIDYSYYLHAVNKLIIDDD